MFTEQLALRAAVSAGNLSPCAKSKRGVVIFHPEKGIISAGKNHPPAGYRCDGSDACRKNCPQLCIHAEMDALRWVTPQAKALQLLHVKVMDGQPVPTGSPSCIGCSKHILESPIQTVWLLEHRGAGAELRSYDTARFHELSLQYRGLPVIR